MNSINAKSVQLIELHAFAYCLLSVSLSESFDYKEFGKRYNQTPKEYRESNKHKDNSLN